MRAEKISRKLSERVKVSDKHITSIMKIQCDVCGKDEAAVFCTADEAALCDACDHRVHGANKLASKHQRFSFVSPSSKDFPVCDVCQEKKAFLFCQQDRAILCRECDVQIHSVNEHTRKHNRFLLTGVKLSSTSALYTAPAAAPPPSASSVVGFDTVPDFLVEASSVGKPPTSASPSQQMPPPPPKPAKTAASTVSPAAVIPGNNSLSVEASQGDDSTSSISEYLIEMLPGWHFEDFLDSCSASFGFCKNGGDNDYGMLPLVGGGGGDDMIGSRCPRSSESLGIWVPQAPTPLSSAAAAANHQFSTRINQFKDTIATIKHSSITHSKRRADDIFAVPQMSPPSTGLKRSRHVHYH
ncbi:hypothetical protein SAY86_004758 [Trapa natans]|uniref:B box-type domain-containing protein n=1 Tax=Trapa natans TaxID=22666 RepID=A0AAN7MJ26_TRANT|nr:hypothetical protein SAY86_004758 [Trapa natans]